MATQSNGGNGNFSGTGGYGGNFPGAGGASNQSNSGGYGGTGGWGTQFGAGGYTAGLTGASGKNSKSGNKAPVGTAGKTYSNPVLFNKPTTQTVGLLGNNLGQPSQNVEVLDPYTQDFYNDAGALGLGFGNGAQGPAVSGGGGVGGGGGGGGIPGPGSGNGGAGWARGGRIDPGEHGWVGENGPEYAFGLPDGSVQITPNHMIGRLVGALSRRR